MVTTKKCLTQNVNSLNTKWNWSNRKSWTTQYCSLLALSMKMILLPSPTIRNFLTISAIEYCQFVTNRMDTYSLLIFLQKKALADAFLLHFLEWHKSNAAQMFELKFVMLIKRNCLSEKFQIGFIESATVIENDHFLAIFLLITHWKCLITLKRFLLYFDFFLNFGLELSFWLIVQKVNLCCNFWV